MEAIVAEEFAIVMSEDQADTRPVLYGRHASPFVRRVAVTLRLYGIGYDHVPLMPFGPDKVELAAFNPIARVPALKRGDLETSKSRQRTRESAVHSVSLPDPTPDRTL